MQSAGYRAPQPTTEEKRVVEDQKKRAERSMKMQKHFTNHGAQTRPTAANMLAVLTHYEEWKGVLAWDDDNDDVFFLKDPPFTAEAATGQTGPRSLDDYGDDFLRIAIWMEREANLVIETTDQHDTLRAVVKMVARKTPAPKRPA